MKALVTLMFISLATFSNAHSFEWNLSSDSVKTVKSVAISKSGTLKTNNGTEITMENVGSGLRSKFGFSVYAAQLLVTAPGEYTRTDDGALASVSTMDGLAIGMTFLRNVSASKMKSAYNQAFKLNGVDRSLEHNKKFIAAATVGGNLKKGQSLWIFAYKDEANSQDVVLYHDNKGNVTTITGPHGFLKDIAAIWLGKVESSLKGLKKDLVHDTY
ncbi:MAG: chalcone isomerase family protein [Bacteriovoracaceae bacterium]